MATRRRVGVSLATTEAARRQLMQPVPCWEQVWVTSTVSPNLKVYKWVKVDKLQHFSDDEDGADEPLAPLPDEPEVLEGDDEEPEEVKNAETQPKDTPDLETNADETPSKLPSPKPESVAAPVPAELEEETLPDALLNPALEEEEEEDRKDSADVDDLQALQVDLDMSVLGPDGLQLESAHDLSQLNPEDALMGPSLLDESVDPFTDTA